MNSGSANGRPPLLDATANGEPVGGHEVIHSRNVDELGPEATDNAIVEHSKSKGFAVLSPDVKDFGNRNAGIDVVVACRE